MLDALKSYYANVRVCVDIPGVGSSAHFDSTTGVKQGCPMSPNATVYTLTNWSITCSHMMKMPPNYLTPKSPSFCMLMILSFCLSRHQVCKSDSMFYSCFVMKSFFQSICPKPRSSFSMISVILTLTLSCILISKSTLSSSTSIWA